MKNWINFVIYCNVYSATVCIMRIAIHFQVERGGKKNEKCWKIGNLEEKEGCSLFSFRWFFFFYHLNFPIWIHYLIKFFICLHRMSSNVQFAWISSLYFAVNFWFEGTTLACSKCCVRQKLISAVCCVYCVPACMFDVECVNGQMKLNYLSIDANAIKSFKCCHFSPFLVLIECCDYVFFAFFFFFRVLK